MKLQHKHPQIPPRSSTSLRNPNPEAESLKDASVRIRHLFKLIIIKPKPSQSLPVQLINPGTESRRGALERRLQ
eukprot:CAMPEP_0184313000 /NCGR_PEP_ID=MMETSP1049-20130417/57996_1 /TAXON_ID=77928 /ORGANISM="Proteomonas sulcata, Strain CCMP704" /LENGTH=73 /DNA_ID=CAMNT_0026629787 /DNA_START=64 /DNA_END=281 /DNA_ORIENTATION=-